MKKPMSLSWKPIRKGRIYCSSACDHDCTHADYRKAHAEARKLCAVLGKRWKPSIWENMGWHYSAVLGDCSVHRHSEYIAYFNGPKQFIGEDKDPNRAVQKAVKEAITFVHAQTAANKVLQGNKCS